MKKMLVLLIVAAFVAGTAFVALADNGPAEIKLEAKMGAVTFPHAKHQGIEADCTVCHHTAADNNAVMENCHSCHGAKADAPKAKKAFHKLCKDCHKSYKKKGAPAPTKCKGCHVK